MKKQEFEERQVRIARTCESFSDYEVGCCPIFDCQLRQWCNRAITVKQAKESSINEEARKN